MHSIRTFDPSLPNLFKLFVVWKLFLLVIAASSPGPGYDTSTDLILQNRGLVTHVVAKLTRWDAIYFVNIAQRGYLYEQEWAFGWGFTRLISLCTTTLRTTTGISGSSTLCLSGLIGIAIAHTAHLLSVLTLFSVTLVLFPRASRGFAFTAASLHVISPAGLFLSAPYAESSCAFATFAGILLFAKSFPESGHAGICHDLIVLASGILFGVATTFRSNGILNGLLLLEEALRLVLSLTQSFEIFQLRRLLATVLGGLCVAVGSLLPQYIAYREYCNDSSLSPLRPWCSKTLPSIYAFVQNHYWHSGLFRYWTISNLPLFLLALPIILITLESSIWALTSQPISQTTPARTRTKLNALLSPRTLPILRSLAITQLLLTIVVLTTAHVQIITRISSSYPVWIWYLATLLQDSNVKFAKVFVRITVIYAVVQGGLFASFLPPA